MAKKGITKWFKDQVTAASIALSNVEKSALGQEGKTLSTGNSTQERKQTQTNLLQALLNGEVNQEVKNLRWRTYKVMQESEGKTTRVVGFKKEIDEETGETYTVPIIETSNINHATILGKIKLDKFDSYPLELVINNEDNTLSVTDMLDKVTLSDQGTNYNLDGIEVKAEAVDATSFFAANKGEGMIRVTRKNIVPFDLERYTKRLNVRVINEEERLLEFYISKYPDEYNRNSRLLISELKKIIDGKRSSILDISEVNFITYNSIGVNDFLEFKYEIKNFDKLIEFDGYYVVKFVGVPVINGDDILAKYKEEELDELYSKKARRKHTI